MFTKCIHFAKLFSLQKGILLFILTHNLPIKSVMLINNKINVCKKLKKKTKNRVSNELWSNEMHFPPPPSMEIYGPNENYDFMVGGELGEVEFVDWCSVGSQIFPRLHKSHTALHTFRRATQIQHSVGTLILSSAAFVTKILIIISDCRTADRKLWSPPILLLTKQFARPHHIFIPIYGLWFCSGLYLYFDCSNESQLRWLIGQENGEGPYPGRQVHQEKMSCLFTFSSFDMLEFMWQVYFSGSLVDYPLCGALCEFDK